MIEKINVGNKRTIIVQQNSTNRPCSILAVLGPTNTGKTHYAIERMLSHKSGTIGLPLRLLAREVYEKIIKVRGINSCALITGEEKVIPNDPKYFVCTVEAMPLTNSVECLVVDEIQLAADPHRGHIFTDRIINSRGISETIFLGSDTARSILKKLVPESKIITRKRFSKLTYSGQKRLTRLPPKSAVIAFSTQTVYEQAEAMRAHRGGCAVVLGALSPRTRNAQIELYQSGDVDYMVATDAIGMGLNMDLDHVAFSSNSKFDGSKTRKLFSSEIAQIAGRAGRHTANGTFGITNDIQAFSEGIISAVEQHKFQKIEKIFWRNSQLDMSSVKELLYSLEKKPPLRFLKRKGDAEDHQTLQTLARDKKIRSLLSTESSVKLLWEACQVPDYTKTLTENHVALISRIFRNLHNRGSLPNSWIRGLVTPLDRIDGDIDTLTARLSHVRTWTYVAHRREWTDDPQYWRDITRSIEDRISDTLHNRLTQRFVEKRISILAKKFGKNKDPVASIDRLGNVLIEGQSVGKMSGFSLILDEETTDKRELARVVNQILPAEIKRRTRQLVESKDNLFTLGIYNKKEKLGVIYWQDAPIGRVTRGQSPIKPDIKLFDSGSIQIELRQKITNRLKIWLNNYIQETLPYSDVNNSKSLKGIVGGVAYHVVESFGFAPRKKIGDILNELNRQDRNQLWEYGIRVGYFGAYVPAALKPKSRMLNSLLWQIYNDSQINAFPYDASAFSIPIAEDLSGSYLNSIGFQLLGPRAIRIDIAERIVREIYNKIKKEPASIDKKIRSLMGCSEEECREIMLSLGYKELTSSGVNKVLYEKLPRKKSPTKPMIKKNQYSPFAPLEIYGPSHDIRRKKV